MEEILSSIRRIIADEQSERSPEQPAPVAAAAAPPIPTPASSLDDDVLELTDVADDEPLQPASAEPFPPAETPIVTSKDEALVSPSAASASTNAFAKLTRSVAPEERPPGPLATQTVQDLVMQLLRPALKDWLDQNLPAIVERVVEQEVKKLARRAELS
jgi:cell pole-organizing protein PopZ